MMCFVSRKDGKVPCQIVSRFLSLSSPSPLLHPNVLCRAGTLVWSSFQQPRAQWLCIKGKCVCWIGKESLWFTYFFLKLCNQPDIYHLLLSPRPVVASQATARVPVAAACVRGDGSESSANIPGSATWRRNWARACVNQQMAYCAPERVSLSAGAWPGSLLGHMACTAAGGKHPLQTALCLNENHSVLCL